MKIKVVQNFKNMFSAGFTIFNNEDVLGTVAAEGSLWSSECVVTIYFKAENNTLQLKRKFVFPD